MKTYKEFLMEQDYIATAVQRGQQVITYSAQGRQIGSVSAGSGQMVSFTPSTVSIKKDGYTYIYDAKGRQLSVVVG